MFRLTNEEKFIGKLVIFVIIGLTFVFYAQKLERDTVQRTIESAELVSIDNNSYEIAFNGEIHSYTFS